MVGVSASAISDQRHPFLSASSCILAWWFPRDAHDSRRSKARAKRFSPAQLSGGRDLVDEAVVERLARVEIAPTPRVLRDLLGGPARAPGEAPVELPQQLLQSATVRSDLLWSAGKPRCRLGEVE